MCEAAPNVSHQAAFVMMHGIVFQAKPQKLFFRLSGIERRRDDVPVFSNDVEAYEVTKANGTLIGYFLFDLFMRFSKRGGAWMSVFHE
tara:strand:- start:7833 stop:8096 length:264 start_codon:yes stop_codon:yes gene_type:complete